MAENIFFEIGRVIAVDNIFKMNNAMIEFRHVSKTFSRKGHPVLALQDINLSISIIALFILNNQAAGNHHTADG
jgi:hypothetical protein